MVDTTDVTHKIALALSEASQRGGSSKKVGSPNKKNMPSPNLKSGKKVKVTSITSVILLCYIISLK